MSAETTAKLEQAAKEFMNLPKAMQEILLAGVMIGKEIVTNGADQEEEVAH